MINAVKKVKQDLEIEQDGNVTFVRELSSGFSLQVTSEQGPECSEGRSHAQNRRISLIGKGRGTYPKGRALWDLRFHIPNKLSGGAHVASTLNSKGLLYTLELDYGVRS